MITEDRRSQRTKKQLRKAFTELMSQKNITNITVTEISNLAKVNRGTFYLHYSDIYDMRRKIETELIDELYNVLNSYSPKNLKKSIFPFLFDICYFCRDNRDLLKIFLCKNGDMVFEDSIKSLVKEKIFHDWKVAYQKQDVKQNEIHFCFIVSGIMGVLKQWISENCEMDVDTLSKLIKNMILNGAQILEENKSKGKF